VGEQLPLLMKNLVPTFIMLFGSMEGEDKGNIEKQRKLLTYFSCLVVRNERKKEEMKED
jgi:hypothetical protein